MKVLRNLSTGIMLLIFVYFGFKSLFVTIWTAPAEPISFSLYGDNNTSLSMIFMPNHTSYLVYVDDNIPFIEAVLLKTVGTRGTHYFGSLWNLNNDSIFGFRLYPENTEPISFELTVLNKFTTNENIVKLQEIGEIFRPIILSSDYSIKLDNMWLEREENDMEYINFLSDELSTMKN